MLINKVLRNVAGELGLGPFTNRGFRHAFGYHFLRAGCDLRYIQKLLGHDCMRSTEVYTKVDKENLKEILDTYHPRR
jgi:integrase/recombinase XerD